MRVDDLLPPGPLARIEYREIVRSPGLSVGVYLLPRGAADPQRPHDEDEVYHVVRGRARFEREGRIEEVGPGSVLFVPAQERHRFLDVEEDLVALVVFGPAEGTNAAPS